MMLLEREILNTALQERLRSGEWKRQNIKLLERALAPGMHVCEIGSGLGYCTQVISRLVQPDGLVVSFEPNPLLHEIAQTRNEESPLTVVVQAAVSSQRGNCRIVGPQREPWRCSIEPDDDGPFPMLHLLDNVVTESSTFTAVVMDCEGGEHEMLDLYATALRNRRVKHIIAEVHGDDQDVDDLIAIMRANRWRMVAKTKRDPWDNVSVWWTPRAEK